MPSSGTEFLDWLDVEAAVFSGATTREYYLNYAGHKEDLSLAPIYERHAGLFTRETVDRALAAGDSDLRARNLREFVVHGYLDQAAQQLTEEIANRETRDTIEWEDEDLPYRAAQQRIINEPDTSKRHELDRRRLLVTAAQNGLRQERWDVLNLQTRDLGFDNYVALCESLGGLDLELLRAMMERFLWDTERPYRDRLEQDLRGIDVDPSLAERSDLQRLFRSPGFDAQFPAGRMLPALDATLRDLRVDAGRQAYIHLDTEERPSKSPRAFCAPVEIPGEVYLVISPHGGHDDYRALFHEGGHAQHFAHIAGDQPFAYRGLGDNSVTEGFAFLLEHLLYSPQWLAKHLDMLDSADYLSMARFHKLYFLRRYAAKLLYELELHADGDTRSKGKRYADLLTAHVGVRYAPEDYLSDVDDGFYCGRYIRAWMFEAQVRSVLTRRCGETWFAGEEAGSLVRKLWSHGQRYSADELLQQLGEDRIDIAPLAADVAI